MPITLITGPANAGKAQVVMDAVRRHLAQGQEPLLVVPTRADAEHYRRELAAGAVILGARVERFEGLIAEAVRRAGVAGAVLGGLARERALAAIATRHGTHEVTGHGARAGSDRSAGVHHMRGARSASPGFVRALAALVAELQVRRVTPARLSDALGRWAAAEGGGAPAVGVGTLFERYHGALRETGRVDEEQRAALALDALRRSPALWGQTPVLFYGFDDLTRLQLDAIETLGAVVGASVTVSLAYEPGRTAFAGRAGTFQAIAPLAAEHHVLPARAEYYAPGARGALSHLERSLFEPDSTRADPGGAVRLLEGGGERAELELVAREIGVLLERGMAPEEIAVLARAPAAAADLLEEVFTAAKIPYALQRRRPFADTGIGRALVGLLHCVPERSVEREGGDGRAVGAAASGGEAAHLLAWLRSPGLLASRAQSPQGRLGHSGGPEAADRLEAKARRNGLSGAEEARALWEQEHWRLEAIDHLRDAAERGSGALIARATRELEWLFSAPRRGTASILARDELDEAQALVAARRALGELAELARIAPELAPGDAGELARLLEGVEFVSGQRPAAGTVAVIDPLALRARRVRALFVCRLQEGVFPAPARPQPLLSEDERRGLAEASGLRLGEHEDALAAERYLLYAATSRPEELLVLSWHAADDDGNPRMRSLFVDDVCDLFEDGLRECVRRPLGAVGWPQPGDSVSPERPAGRPACDQTITPQPAPLRDEELLAELRGHTWSASSLEVWMSCPVRWLVERMLRAGDLDPDPEPLSRGALAHAALKDTLEGLRRETGSARLTPGRLGLARELLKAAIASNGADFALSAAPERRPGLRRRLEADLDRYLEHAAGSAPEPAHGVPCPHAGEGPLEPTHLELEFGFSDGDQQGQPGDLPAGQPGDLPTDQPGALPAFDLGGGVMLRGRIDRVDIGPGGEAVVYDYKGRSASPAAKWIAEGEVQVALYMRAIEALLGLRAVGGFYQPLTGGDLRARGVLAGEHRAQIESVGADRREEEDVRALVSEAVAAAREAAAQAGRGELQARPRTCAFQGGCSYPTICRSERR
jgi:PD-(D/E)XK nuclease superfamily